MKIPLLFWVLLIAVLWILLKRDEVLVLGGLLFAFVLVVGGINEGYTSLGNVV